MLFCSREFLIFFALVFSLYWAIPWKQARVGLLLIASFVFYASWSKELAGIVVLSATLDYFLALGMESSRRVGLRRLLLLVSITANLGLLCYFKYANFFLQSLQEALQRCGVPGVLPVLQVILPIGISFYTFEAINYTVDVYRQQTKAERNLAHFLVFILFFPHLVAGPIVRARDFLHQVRRKKRWNWIRAAVGCEYVLLGVFKKLVVADRMGLLAEAVFAHPTHFRVECVWIGVIAYALQIYCDFSGYSDLALGTAHLLGYRLAQNFDMPYLSRNIAEFWRRWHISLSSWLRDYLFIPLGGSRGTLWQTCRNLMITMTLGGLWHGASWTFVVWGVLHGLLLVLHRLFRLVTDRVRVLAQVLRSPGATPFCVVLTFLCVCLGWVFFRAQTFGGALLVFKHLVVSGGTEALPMPKTAFWVVLALVATGHLLGKMQVWKRIPSLVPAPIVGIAYSLGLTLTLVLAPPTGQTFIYFQF